MSTIHFILQGKGGVGKSYIASLLAQYQKEKSPSIKCFDTDPINKTFSQYSALDVKKIDLLENAKINERQFDHLITEIFSDTESNFVIDNGAASFMPLSNYLLENGVFTALNDAGKTIYIHTIIVGGQALRDTASGLNSLAQQFGEQAKLVVWLNEFFGKIFYSGQSFEDMKVYKNNQKCIAGMITITQKTRETFGLDIENMQKAKLTFDEAIADPKVHIMNKQRLKMTKREIWQQLDDLFS
ncbi:MAG: conjugal transfer protein TraL [Endozoicomonas sp. (ex Botrylloides leachii)]|nr:conjugal transfer protein TraL [Endozoicomonas sp. (ex Botrylloides leachii)]